MDTQPIGIKTRATDLLIELTISGEVLLRGAGITQSIDVYGSGGQRYIHVDCRFLLNEGDCILAHPTF